MDNLTHTVIGLVAGETLARVTRSRRRTSLLAIGMIGGNLPDGDLAVSYGGGKLGYLLQHRGYTHTIVGCIALALLLYFVVALIHRARRDPLTRNEHMMAAAFTVFAVLLHLGMDALNSYGVHPFWPFNDRWFYGDVLFIVEPAFWIAAAPLVFLQRTRGARIGLGSAVAVAVALNVVLHAGQVTQWIAVALVALGLVVIGRKAGPRVAALVSAATAIGVTLMFGVSSLLAARAVEASAASRFAGESNLDEVLSPAPMQPLCWDVLSMRRTPGRYFVRQANVALASDAGTARCSRLQLGAAGTAPWTALDERLPRDRRVLWRSALDVPVAAFAQHIRGDCRAEALMQFARVPYVGLWEGQWYVGDLRFDREADLGFAELLVNEPGQSCPRAVPWSAPRADLLERP
ncbi:MAG: metal-dependent hydrolase [Casimicrobiaceae bacterium]